MLGLNSEAWTAIAAWATVAIAVAAALFAGWQVLEARRTREEQARPQVMVYMDWTVSPKFIDLVIRNFGKTGAHSVRLDAKPPLFRASDGTSEPVRLPDEIPTLVPGQEWRTFWNTDMDRKGSELPDVHEVTVTYTDRHGKPFVSSARLDWRVYEGTHWVEKKDLNDAAKALDKIAKVVKKLEDANGGLAVVTRDGHALDERRAEELKARRKLLEEQRDNSAKEDPVSGTTGKPEGDT